MTLLNSLGHFERRRIRGGLRYGARCGCRSLGASSRVGSAVLAPSSLWFLDVRRNKRQNVLEVQITRRAPRAISKALRPAGRARQALTRSTLTLDGAGPGCSTCSAARRADAHALSDLISPRCGPGRARQALARRSTCSAARRVDLDGAPGPVQALDAGQALDVRTWTRSRTAARPVRDLDALARRSTCSAARRVDLDGAPGPVQALDAGQALDVRTWTRSRTAARPVADLDALATLEV